MKVSSANVEYVKAWLGVFVLCATCAAARGADFPGVFHVVGLPTVKRGQRLLLKVNNDEVLFDRHGALYRISLARMNQVTLFDGERNYEKSTFAAALASSAFGIPVGQFLILKKHKVLTAVIDFRSEANGQMGAVLQLEKSAGEEFGRALTAAGVKVVIPAPKPSEKNKAEKDSAKKEIGHNP